MFKNFEITFEVEGCVWLPKSEVLRPNERIRFAEDGGILTVFAVRGLEANLIGRVPAYVADMIRPYLRLGITLDTAFMGGDSDTACAWIGVRVSPDDCDRRARMIQQLHDPRKRLELQRSADNEFWSGVETRSFRQH